MKTITSIEQHAISATVKELQGQTINHIEKLGLSGEGEQKIEIIQEIMQSNQKIQLKNQKQLQCLAEFKQGVYQMREKLSKAIIGRHCSGLMKIFPLDSFVKNKVRELYKVNRISLAGIIKISGMNWMYIGEAENGVPEGRGVFYNPNGAVYDL